MTNPTERRRQIPVRCITHATQPIGFYQFQTLSLQQEAQYCAQLRNRLNNNNATPTGEVIITSMDRALAARIRGAV